MKRNNKVAILILSIILILSLTACDTGARLIHKGISTYQGESQNWEGTLVTEFIEWEEDEGNNAIKFESENKLKLKYKGAGIDGVGTIEYEFSNSPANIVVRGTSSLDSEGVISDISKSGSESSDLSKGNLIFTVTVEWDDNKETFEMDWVKD